jgi:Mrp family chromosome partitioning ATPase
MNENCPGPESKDAGMNSNCKGCPNQSVCSSKQDLKKDLTKINDNLKEIKSKFLVLSGKGGVGKSTVTANLAYSFLKKDLEVGVLDLDITGPSIPKIMGVEKETVHSSNSGWSPVWVEDNLCCMSIGFLSDPDQAILWRGPKKNGLIESFLEKVEWDVDVLIIDTPPGTSDEHLSIVSYLKESGITGAILVSTSSQESILDVTRELKFCQRVNIPIIGIIENMSSFTCKCGKKSRIFSGNKVQKLAEEYNIKFLGSIPLDPKLGKSCDFGKNFLTNFPQSPVTFAYQKILEEIDEVVRSKGSTKD